MDWAVRVLPVPGGPWRSIIRPLPVRGVSLMGEGGREGRELAFAFDEVFEARISLCIAVDEGVD